MTVFLDLDGVLRSFTDGVAKLFDLDFTDDDVTYWNFLSDVVEKERGLDINGFWGKMTPDWWANLPRTPQFDKVLELVKPIEPVILTSPASNSAGGTQRWIEKNLPDYRKRYLIGVCKEVLAPGNLLIDDYDGNIDKFYGAGGDVIFFPRPWNRMHMFKDPVSFLKNELKERKLI